MDWINEKKQYTEEKIQNLLKYGSIDEEQAASMRAHRELMEKNENQYRGNYKSLSGLYQDMITWRVIDDLSPDDKYFHVKEKFVEQEKIFIESAIDTIDYDSPFAGRDIVEKIELHWLKWINAHPEEIQ